MSSSTIFKLKSSRVSGLSILLVLCLILQACGSDGADTPQAIAPVDITSSTGGETNAVCPSSDDAREVQAPLFEYNIPGKTGWFASPLVADLNNDATREIIAALGGIYVFDAQGRLLGSASGNGERIYAPHAVIDLDNEGVMDIVCGQDHQLYVYEWRNARLQLKTGWPADTTSAGWEPEIRGLAVADLDGMGPLEIVATTTQKQPTKEKGGAQVFVFDAGGQLHALVFSPGRSLAHRSAQRPIAPI